MGPDEVGSTKRLFGIEKNLKFIHLKQISMQEKKTIQIKKESFVT